MINYDGTQIGIIPIDEAMAKAIASGFDLVEISPDADPPVCKLMDYGKFLYQKEKKAKDARKSQKTVTIKEMKFGLKIDKHDFDYRIKHIREFLSKDNKVKITIRFRGRELSHTEMGFELMNRILEELKEDCQVEKQPKLEGRTISAVIGS